MSERWQARITGVVQGVAFRYYAQREAQRLGLVGTVVNRRDGSVELIAEGPPEALRALAAWAQDGSPAAEVDHVESRTLPATGEFRDFSILRTGAQS